MALTEYGIYRLFLSRLNYFITNQTTCLTFFQNYSDSALFEVFLYPYFKKETLLAIGPSLLLDLYGYLSTCCESIERNILDSGLIKIATEFYEGIFSWDKVPGEDNTPLLFHLKHMFKLKGQGPYYIKKEDNVENPTITVSWPSAPLIILKLDKARHKVLITSKVDGQITELEYEVTEMVFTASYL